MDYCFRFNQKTLRQAGVGGGGDPRKSAPMEELLGLLCLGLREFPEARAALKGLLDKCLAKEVNEEETDHGGNG